MEAASSDHRASTIWLGDVLPSMTEKDVAAPLVAHDLKVVSMQIRRKGWRDLDGRRIGFALVTLSSPEAAAETETKAEDTPFFGGEARASRATGERMDSCV